MNCLPCLHQAKALTATYMRSMVISPARRARFPAQTSAAPSLAPAIFEEERAAGAQTSPSDSVRACTARGRLIFPISMRKDLRLTVSMIACLWSPTIGSNGCKTSIGAGLPIGRITLLANLPHSY